ncbi:hypothetical protein COO60DRAFT_160012 [Scenedesmus sp. NREL 46B-D3]|nr:hypothetical protein COO60DRAFT_160012 [Scenedesmus sp. NREL 46B-D3]
MKMVKNVIFFNARAGARCARAGVQPSLRAAQGIVWMNRNLQETQANMLASNARVCGARAAAGAAVHVLAAMPCVYLMSLQQQLHCIRTSVSTHQGCRCCAQMEYGVRQLIPECRCNSTLRVVVDTSGVHIGTTLRNRGVFQRVGHVMDRMYPCRLQVLYMVGLPFPLRWTFKACLQLLHVHTRKKIRMCRVTDVPRRLPSQLRSHKLSAATGLDGWAFLETASFVDGAGTAADSGADSGAEEPFTPHSVRAPVTPRVGPPVKRRGSGGGGAGAPGQMVQLCRAMGLVAGAAAAWGGGGRGCRRHWCGEACWWLAAWRLCCICCCCSGWCLAAAGCCLVSLLGQRCCG